MPPSLNLNLNFGRRRSPALVGLDIQPGYVAAVQAQVNGSILVEQACSAALGADIVREGEVLDEGALAETLRELFRDSQLSKRVRIGVANQRTVLRTLDLPPVSDRKDLAAAVRFQAEDQIPMPLANAVLDFQSLGEIDTPAGTRQRVIVVAAQRDMVERLLAAVRAAGLRPEGVDLSAFALIRSLYRADAAAAGEQPGRVLYLNIGGLTNMAIAEGTICRFTRVVGGGLEAMAIEVAERRNIPLVDARALLAAVDLTAPATVEEPVSEPQEIAGEEPQEIAAVPEPATEALEPAEAPPSGEGEASAAAEQPAPEETPTMAARFDAALKSSQQGRSRKISAPPVPAPDADVRAVLENGIREIAGEVRNSLDFHRSQEGGGEVASVVLSGPALEMPGFAQVLEADLSMSVLSREVNVAPGDVLQAVSAHRLAVAAGLAAEEVHP